MNGPLNLFLEWWHPDISASFAENLSEVYNRMLNNLLFNSSSQVKNLSTLTKWDRNQILEWNSIVPKTVEKCIHEVIEENVYHQPDAEAVCAWDGSLTYAELDRLASSLMSHLLGFGVGPETYVALCFDKSVGAPSSCQTVSRELINLVEMEHRRHAGCTEGRGSVCST